MTIARAFLVFACLCSSSLAAELLAFTAKWCGPCQRFHRDRGLFSVPIRSIDVDQDRAMARRYGVRNYPTFVLEEDGREIRRTVGYDGPEALKRWLEGQ